MISSKNSSSHPKRAFTGHANVAKVVHNRKVVAKIGGPKAVLAVLQSIADALIP
ncbi:MAG: hypothetical protein ABI183_11015 [Polyangiaceae bacterium]